MYDYKIKIDIHEWAKDKGNNVATRQEQTNCHELRQFDNNTSLNVVSYHSPTSITCYGCNKAIHSTHAVYIYTCKDCGNLFQLNRHLTRDLNGYVATVIGGRTKLGHQIAIKLLIAGAKVIITTRFPERALDIFSKYPEWNSWKSNLFIYPSSLDLDVADISMIANEFGKWCDQQFGRIDILIMCAAQTIRIREKNKFSAGSNTDHPEDQEQNRYQDAKFVEENTINSWEMKLPDLIQEEMEEVYRINAIAPVLFVQQLSSLLENSSFHPYVINVHAREGLFQVRKSSSHIHTNMAKAALAMFTKCLKKAKLKTKTGKQVWIHGCDPGWISIDEYYKSQLPWPCAPIDEIDGAARILYPIMANLKGSFEQSRRHFKLMHY